MELFPKVFILIAVISGLFLLYSIIVYFFSRVPYIATPRKRFDSIFEHLFHQLSKEPQEISMVDLGSGYGNVLFEAERRGIKKLIGYELSPLHIWVAKARTLFMHSQVKSIRKNYFDADVSNVDILFLFLNQPAITKLSNKILSETRSGTLVVVVGDELEGVEPIDVITYGDGTNVKIRLYRIS